MTNDPGGAWAPICNAQTTREELNRIIDRWTRYVLVDVLLQIETMDLGPRDQATALVLIAPILRAQTAAALTSAWTDLRASGPVH